MWKLIWLNGSLFITMLANFFAIVHVIITLISYFLEWLKPLHFAVENMISQSKNLVNCFLIVLIVSHYFSHCFTSFQWWVHLLLLSYCIRVINLWYLKIITLLNLRLFCCWISAGCEIWFVSNSGISLPFPVCEYWLCHACLCILFQIPVAIMFFPQFHVWY